ncbi:MAG: two-component sensor histidine kinase [Corynebacteriales bacterium]|nr:two-component sensor histidine kinase [Mycobacteriales bacterium]
MRVPAFRPHNGPVEPDERRGWRQQLRETLRPEATPANLSGWALRVDVLLAILLTVIALIVMARYPDSGPVQIKRDAPFVPPEPPVPPAPPNPADPGARGPEELSSFLLWPLVVLSALPLIYRRRFPLGTFMLVMGATLAMVDEATWMNVATCVIGAYSAVIYSRYRVWAIVGMVISAALAGFAFRDTEPIIPGWSSPAVVLLIAGVLASVVRSWRRQLTASRDRYTQLQDAQNEAMRQAIIEERSRIAAELHDVVTHNVSVMVIQAGAARKVMESAPERSREALLAVEAGGRAAMAELRQVMDLLAAPDDERSEGLEPQPGLGQLDSLIERVRAAGMRVRTAVSLPSEPLPSGVDLAAYRVVQEALTNAMKHAPGAEATVTIGYADHCLEIEITDTGGVRETAGDGNGRGLIGLRERLAVYKGELMAGPTVVGGYRVKARVPWPMI